MGIWQIILTLVFYIWLFLMLWLFWVIGQRVLKLLQMLIDTAQKTAEAACKTAEAVYHTQQGEPKK